jgi:hypothetical protein
MPSGAARGKPSPDAEQLLLNLPASRTMIISKKKKESKKVKEINQKQRDYEGNEDLGRDKLLLP